MNDCGFEWWDPFSENQSGDFVIADAQTGDVVYTNYWTTEPGRTNFYINPMIRRAVGEFNVENDNPLIRGFIR